MNVIVMEMKQILVRRTIKVENEQRTDMKKNGSRGLPTISTEAVATRTRGERQRVSKFYTTAVIMLPPPATAPTFMMAATAGADMMPLSPSPSPPPLLICSRCCCDAAAVANAAANDLDHLRKITYPEADRGTLSTSHA